VNCKVYFNLYIHYLNFKFAWHLCPHDRRSVQFDWVDATGHSLRLLEAALIEMRDEIIRFLRVAYFRKGLPVSRNLSVACCIFAGSGVSDRVNAVLASSASAMCEKISDRQLGWLEIYSRGVIVSSTTFV
jgi:hypothetical protein